MINQILAFLLERGISFRKGPASLRRQLPAILENADEARLLRQWPVASRPIFEECYTSCAAFRPNAVLPDLDFNISGGGDSHMSNRKPGANTSNRPTVNLNGKLEKKLAAYTLTAGAAGLAVLAGAPRAEGQVVYTNIWIPLPIGQATNIDINGDGVADFQFANNVAVRSPHCTNSNSRGRCESLNVVPPVGSNAIWGTNGTASALASGVSVGSNPKLQPNHQFMALEATGFSSGGYGYGSGGPWCEATRMFLGVKLVIQGQVHYGWVRLNVSASTQGMYAAVSGYAYETQPNTPILTGQTSGGSNKNKRKDARRVGINTSAPGKGSLGLLAAGSFGLQVSEDNDTNRD